MGSEPDPNLVLAVLREIRDEAKQTNVRLDDTVQRLDQTVERLDRLERRQLEMEARLSTELVAVVSAVGEVRDLLRADLTMRATVVDHEARIQVLERGAAGR